MAFSEAVKLEAKRRAHFQCVVCKSPYFVEVHHITPQADEGSDDIGNAAPLCSSCHSWFGGNPDKRKAITQMRDFHWELCERIASGPSMAATFERLDRLQAELAAQRQDQVTLSKTLGEIKATLVNSLTKQLEQINRASTFADVVAASTGMLIGTAPLGTVQTNYSPPPNPKCKTCGFALPLAIDRCPYCGEAV